MYLGGYYSSYVIFVLPAILLAMYAQMKVTSTFSRYSKVTSRGGNTAAQIAEKILRMHGITNVNVERVTGNLTDHYDPRSHTLRLSDSVYGSTSVAAIGVAAHEAGHAIQHNTGYFPIKLRNMVLPVANIGSQAAIPLAILGLILSANVLVEIGIILFTAVVAFQIITLPVEFNASRRAINILESNYLLDAEETKGASKVLKAAALTYVAAAATAIGNLLRLLSIARRRD
ncbi:MAG: zinc metallopeptidase [Clostridia bacterium]|nr:zinc metallopeptidase [Clostridia bacterium]